MSKNKKKQKIDVSAIGFDRRSNQTVQARRARRRTTCRAMSTPFAVDNHAMMHSFVDFLSDCRIVGAVE
jgi:hypothetical protein